MSTIFTRRLIQLEFKFISYSLNHRSNSAACLHRILRPAPIDLHTSHTFSNASSTETSQIIKDAYNIGKRNITTLSTGGIVNAPKRHGGLGLIKAFFTCLAGLTVGAWFSKVMVVFLEENELFVPDDDDDEDDED